MDQVWVTARARPSMGGKYLSPALASPLGGSKVSAQTQQSGGGPLVRSLPPAAARVAAFLSLFTLNIETGMMNIYPKCKTRRYT